jgi:hypothetical protein
MSWEPWSAEDFVKVFNRLRPEFIPYIADGLYGLNLEMEIPADLAHKGDSECFCAPLKPPATNEELDLLSTINLVLSKCRPPMAEVNRLLAPKGIRFLIIEWEKKVIVP